MREKRDILSKVQSSKEVERFEKLKTQFDKLNEIKDSMQSANEQLRDKIERRVPKDVSIIIFSNISFFDVSIIISNCLHSFFAPPPIVLS